MTRKIIEHFFRELMVVGALMALLPAYPFLLLQELSKPCGTDMSNASRFGFAWVNKFINPFAQIVEWTKSITPRSQS